MTRYSDDDLDQLAELHEPASAVLDLVPQARLANALSRGLRRLERQTERGNDWIHCAVCGGYLDPRMGGRAGHLDGCALVPLLALVESSP